MEEVVETYKAIYIITSILVEMAIILYGIGTIMILKSYREKGMIDNENRSRDVCKDKRRGNI